MYVCRHATTKVVVFVTTSGEVTISENELVSVSALEFSGNAEGWGTAQGYEVINLSEEDVDLPADYSGEMYKLVEDNGSYRFDPILE